MSCRDKKGDSHTVRVSLDFNNHLLQTPDNLFATFFGHLLGKEFLGATSIFARSSLGIVSRLLGLLLVLRGDLLIGRLLKALGDCRGTGLGIDVGSRNFAFASGRGVGALFNSGLNIFLVLVRVSMHKIT